jgi:hypothetical protein
MLLKTVGHLLCMLSFLEAGDALTGSVVQNVLKLHKGTAQRACTCAVHRAGGRYIHGFLTRTVFSRVDSMTNDCRKKKRG